MLPTDLSLANFAKCSVTSVTSPFWAVPAAISTPGVGAYSVFVHVFNMVPVENFTEPLQSLILRFCSDLTPVYFVCIFWHRCHSLDCCDLHYQNIITSRMRQIVWVLVLISCFCCEHHESYKEETLQKTACYSPQDSLAVDERSHPFVSHRNLATQTEAEITSLERPEPFCQNYNKSHDRPCLNIMDHGDIPTASSGSKRNQPIADFGGNLGKL